MHLKLEAPAPHLSLHRNIETYWMRSSEVWIRLRDGGREDTGFTGYQRRQGGSLQIEEQLVTDASLSEELLLIIPYYTVIAVSFGPLSAPVLR